MSKETLSDYALPQRVYFLCDPCQGTGKNPKMSTITPADHPACNNCMGRGWVNIPNYKSPHVNTLGEAVELLQEALHWVSETKDVHSCDTEAKIKKFLNRTLTNP